MVGKELIWQGGKFLLNDLAIVIAPHQDDESIGMGGSIAKMVDFGFTVHIIYVTVEKRSEKLNTNPVIRKNEAIEALRVLGITSRHQIHFLDFPDGALKIVAQDFSKSAGKLRALVKKIEENNTLKAHYAKTLVLTTSRYDAHRDHEETYNLIKNALRKKIIMEFPTVNHLSSTYQSNCIIDISAYSSLKKDALCAYKGEIAKQRILWDEIAYLDNWMGKYIGVTSAESCFISWFGLIRTDQTL